MPDYAENAKINADSLLNVISEIESEIDMLPGTIGDLQVKLSPLLKPEHAASDIAPKDGSEIQPISSNSDVYDRLVEALRRIRGARLRIHEVTDRVQL